MAILRKSASVSEKHFPPRFQCCCFSTLMMEAAGFCELLVWGVTSDKAVFFILTVVRN
jgi:hypothetical protein